MSNPHILVVDDEPDIRQTVSEILEDEGYQVSQAEDAKAAREARRARKLDLALLDIWMPETDGISLLREWAETGDLPFPVIMMSGHGTVETAVEATKLGAYDFVEKPISLAKLLLTVERALEAGELRRENEGLRSRLPVVEPVGVSEAMRDIKSQAKRLAQHDTWILINGEAGVGKATFARYLHNLSGRRDGPFIELNAGSVAPENSAVELFGSELADQVRYGKLEQAHGGTLFIDEVAQMDPETQVRLSAALDSGNIMRIGGKESIPIDVRVIAATRANLEEMVSQDKFRQELYYQLNVVPITIPALRERPEDVPELLRFYAEFFPNQDKLEYRHFSVAAQNRLRQYQWPGNVRELQNLVQRLLILGSGEVELDEVEQALGNLMPVPCGDQLSGVDFQLPLREAREQFERAYLVSRLKDVGGSVGKLANVSGMERTHLYRKLRSLDIDPKSINDKD